MMDLSNTLFDRYHNNVPLETVVKSLIIMQPVGLRHHNTYQFLSYLF